MAEILPFKPAPKPQRHPVLELLDYVELIEGFIAAVTKKTENLEAEQGIVHFERSRTTRENLERHPQIAEICEWASDPNFDHVDHDRGNQLLENLADIRRTFLSIQSASERIATMLGGEALPVFDQSALDTLETVAKNVLQQLGNQNV